MTERLEKESYELLRSAGKCLEKTWNCERRNKRDEADAMRAEARVLLAKRQRKLAAGQRFFRPQ